MANGKIVIETELNTDNFDKGLNSMDKSSQGWSTAMKATILGVGVAVTGLGTSFIKAGLDFNTAVENYQTSFEVMLGSQEAAAAKMQELIDIGASTPFELTELADATQQLLAFGVASDDTSKYLTQLGDISQGNSDKLNSLVLSFGKMNASQKVSLETLNIMIERGFNPLNIIAEKTGETMADLYQRVSDGGVAFEEITEAIEIATSEGGQFYQSMEKQSQTLTGVTSTLSDEFNNFAGKVTEPLFNFIKKTAVPAMSNLIKTMSKKIDDTDWEAVGKTMQKIWDIAVFATKAFITLKAAMIMDKVLKSIQTAQLQLALFSATTDKAGLGVAVWNGTLKASESILGILTGKISLASVAQGGLNVATQAFNTFLKANPILAVTGLLIGMVTAIKLVTDAMNKDVVESTKNIADGIASFAEGVKTAESQLSNFDKAFEQFNDESSRITDDISEVQNGITAITKVAAEERRALTESEIAKIDEYFEKLNTLNEEQLAIEEAKAKAVQTQALLMAQTTDTSLAEYQTYSEQWIATAKEQADAQIALIEEQTTNELALLNQKYGDKANLENEAYAKEVETITQRKDERLQAATNEQAEIYNAFAKGIEDRLGLTDDYNTKVEEYNTQLANIEAKRLADLELANEGYYVSEKQKQDKIDAINKNALAESNKVNAKQKTIWYDLIKSLSDSEEEQLGVWLSMISNTELYGGELDTETQDIFDGVIANFDQLPKSAKNVMKDALTPMLEEMEETEPTLLAKAEGIAGGILSTLKKSFDIHSPSRKTREIFKYVMEGAELGIEDEEDKLLNQADKLTDDLTSSFEKMQSAVNLETSKMNTNVQTGKTYNNIMNTIPVNINNKNESVLKVNGRTLAEVINEENNNIDLQYGY